jgi:hypothetical protein
MTRMDRGMKGSDHRNGAAILANVSRAAPILLCALVGCWESAGQGDGSGSDTDGDGDTDQQTDSLDGWSCTDLSPCVQSDVSGFTCPGFATDVKCWNLGSQCDAVYLCASAAQACEIGCAATHCEESAAIPPQPVCD